MRKSTDFIVNHCYVIFVVFLVLTGICGILATQVKINKDIYSYMPESSETSRGLAIMDDEFDYSATSSYEMMLTDVPTDEKMAIKEHIESIDGVDSVEYDESDKYNRDQYTRYIINVGAPADSETAARVYNTIHDEYSERFEVAESGKVNDYNGAVLQVHIAIFAVACAMVILIIMSKSWVEPFLFLFAILLAVVVNKGTNIIFPNVSHITDAIAAILQMALSMDYAIMLSTRYRQEKAKADCPDKQTAMRRAMRYSFGAISSSSVTTVVGLLVLVLMSFTIGRDMGLVLSKGVILSLVSIFTTLPALLLLFDKAIEKTAKKTINFNMAWLGRFSHAFRRLALPLFIIVFAGSFMLKGSTTIDFTSSENNKIKDVFEEANQMALVYDGKMDEQVTDICKKYDAREDTVRVLCYGNTINEPEKYNELVPKINELSDEKVDTEDYLIKAIYYHYYKNTDNLTITLDDFVKFLQRDVFPSEKFSGEVTNEMREKVEQFSYFTDQKKVNQPRTKAEIAKILGVDEKKLDEVFVLWLSEQKSPVRLTLYQFAQFVSSDILTNPKYASMVTAAQRKDLASLKLFSDHNYTDTPKSAAELSRAFGISQSAIEQILVYYDFMTTDTPTATATISELVNFALTNKNVLAELKLSDEEAAKIRAQLAEAKTTAENMKAEVQTRYGEFNTKLDAAVAELPAETQTEVAPYVTKLRTEIEQKIQAAETALNKEYSYSDYAAVASKINAALDSATAWLDNLDKQYPEVFAQLSDEMKAEVMGYAKKISDKIAEARTKVDLDGKLAQLKQIYKLYQAEKNAKNRKISPRALVNFLLQHAGDEKLKGALNADAISKLQLVKYIMDNQSTKYSSGEMAQAFSLDAEKLRLVFALYDYRHVNTNPKISLWNLINFIDEKILPNKEYASRLSEHEQTELATIATLMRAAKSGVLYNYDALYRAIRPLSGNLDEDKLFLAYLYYGSLYNYDENWTLTLEQFINFVNDKILPDSRFAKRIDDEMRQKVIDGKKTIGDAKEMLVGPKHYRALIETNLPAEGETTFAFIKGLKDELGPKNNVDYYVLGDSAMAYEMSQTFGGEMDMITVITMLAIFAVVVCTFRSIFVSLLLVLVIQCAVYIVMSYLSLTGSSIFFIALIIVQAILMGATIDYAILFTSYYVENRNYFKLGVKDALINTYNKSISAILTSASILIIVTAIVGNFTSAIAGKICQSISLGTFCATLIILLLLPALLATLDRFIIKNKKPGKSKIANALKTLL
ncbi:MMPL family transporter [Candidatus Saccharibacteria bacterium]|nr:MMPL family transporter [Candidatus Saccharibacteria bacterium]